jgi:hypothetical protein
MKIKEKKEFAQPELQEMNRCKKHPSAKIKEEITIYLI